MKGQKNRPWFFLVLLLVVVSCNTKQYIASSSNNEWMIIIESVTRVESTDTLTVLADLGFKCEKGQEIVGIEIGRNNWTGNIETIGVYVGKPFPIGQEIDPNMRCHRSVTFEEDVVLSDEGGQIIPFHFATFPSTGWKIIEGQKIYTFEYKNDVVTIAIVLGFELPSHSGNLIFRFKDLPPIEILEPLIEK